jgi:hypothetical protein
MRLFHWKYGYGLNYITHSRQLNDLIATVVGGYACEIAF